MALHFSVVIPAYQESSRLPPYLGMMRPYLDAVFPDAYEVIVVDDGSTDRLASAVGGCSRSWPQLSVLRHCRNLGKGAALLTGMRAASASLLLAADADGATPIEEEKSLRQVIAGGADIAIGSRLLRLPGRGVQRLCSRQLSGQLFSLLVRCLFGLPVRDTQCGFKMFRREAALSLLPHCREAGYLFDLEILAWAHRLGFRIAEVPVTWRDVTGSKVRLLSDGWAMLWGLFRLHRAIRRIDLPLGPAPVSVPVPPYAGSPPPH